jgi:hypothetical protein
MNFSPFLRKRDIEDLRSWDSSFLGTDSLAGSYELIKLGRFICGGLNLIYSLSRPSLLRVSGVGFPVLLSHPMHS